MFKDTFPSHSIPMELQLCTLISRLTRGLYGVCRWELTLFMKVQLKHCTRSKDRHLGYPTVLLGNGLCKHCGLSEDLWDEWPWFGAVFFFFFFFIVDLHLNLHHTVSSALAPQFRVPLGGVNKKIWATFLLFL